MRPVMQLLCALFVAPIIAAFVLSLPAGKPVVHTPPPPPETPLHPDYKLLIELGQAQAINRRLGAAVPEIAARLDGVVARQDSILIALAEHTR